MRNLSRGTFRTLVAAGTVLWLSSAASSASAATIGQAGQQHGQGRGSLAPEVIKTGRGPTGYSVTFRFKDPSATSVQIKGEWYFASPSDISARASTATSVVKTPGLLPSQWTPGDFPIASPNSTAPNWPVTSMKPGSDGIWTYTTPLPSGVFNYGFYVNCASAAQTGCTEISDPSNPPWNAKNGTSTGSVEATSQVYVPSDPKFGSVNYWWQGPSRAQGSLTDVTYSSPGHVTPAGANYLAVYTPPGYNPHRSTPYPTLYLSHGGGGNEVDWSTQGDLENILDNLISTGQIQPMIVVMPNANGYPASANYAAYDSDLTRDIIPYVQSHYDVSGSAAGRAFSGLSMGGAITNSIMLGSDSAEFGYYGVMSAGIACPAKGCTSVTLTAAQAAVLEHAGVFVGGGWQDPVHAAGYQGMDTGTAQEVASLEKAGVRLTPDFINGGHEWYVWRTLLKDFLTRVAFARRMA